MSGKITKLELSDLVFDESLYPRVHPDQQYIAELARAMGGGSTLPPIVVCRETKKIIDGVHRFNAALRLDEKTITVELRDYKDDAERYRDAVLLNTAQGMRLGTADMLKVISRAEELGFKDVDLAGMLRTSLDHLQALKPRYALLDQAYMEGGGKLKKVPLKASVRHLAGENISQQQADAMHSAPGNSYLLITRQLITALDCNLVPSSENHPTLWAELAALRNLLNSILGRQEAA